VSGERIVKAGVKLLADELPEALSGVVCWVPLSFWAGVTDPTGTLNAGIWLG